MPSELLSPRQQSHPHSSITTINDENDIDQHNRRLSGNKRKLKNDENQRPTTAPTDKHEKVTARRTTYTDETENVIKMQQQQADNMAGPIEMVEKQY